VVIFKKNELLTSQDSAATSNILKLGWGMLHDVIANFLPFPAVNFFGKSAKV